MTPGAIPARRGESWGSSASWLGRARRLLDGLLAVTVAPTCAVCTVPLQRPSRGPVCDSCWNAIRRLTPPLCRTCGIPLPSARTDRCGRCRRLSPPVVRACALGEYDGTLRTIIHALKYGRQRSIAPRLAELMRRHGELILKDADLSVPVPLHVSRRRARGFNQSADLAAHLGLPVVQVLRRGRRTPPQTGLPAARRHANVRGAFRVSQGGGASVAGRIVLLVDDVWTTGATLEACARCLREAGAREVRAITAARATRRSPP